MNKGFVIGLASVIIGCIGLGYVLGAQQRNNVDDSDEDQDEEKETIIDRCFEEVRWYMNRKANARAEYIQLGKDFLTNKSYRLTIGLVTIGIGVGLIASAYIPVLA